MRFATAATGTRYKGRDDVMLVELAAGTAIAGVYTTSATRAAPVLDCQSKTGSVSADKAAIFVNAGNANAFTGARGSQTVEAICSAVSDRLALPEGRVFTASTGVIGEPLEADAITAHFDALVTGLGDRSIEAAAGAIRTTDTFAKGAGRVVEVNGQPVRINGIAKGSGMIQPDMATMLAFVFTDAKIDQPTLQSILSDKINGTFNAITVDSDTSTSDTTIVAATGASGVDVSDSPEFADGLEAVLRDLAHQVVRDGEGATKFVEVRVTGAGSTQDARRAAFAIANSPLVKTAIAGEDPNWGRIVMAVGKSGANADRDRLSIWFGDVLVADQGWVSASYREEDGASYMRGQELTITVDLGIGDARFTAWTCDLTHGYIEINADYRS